MTTTTPTPTVISGIDAMRGVGAARAKGFWADAWERVLQRKTAIAALTWIAIVAFFAVFAPFIANGHPIYMEVTTSTGEVIRKWPLLDHLTATDVLLVLGTFTGIVLLLLPLPMPRSARLSLLIVMALQAGATVLGMMILDSWLGDTGRLPQWLENPWVAGAVVALIAAIPFFLLHPVDRVAARVAAVVVVAAVSCGVITITHGEHLTDYDAYAEGELAGRIKAVYTLIPWSPDQRRTDLYVKPPMTRLQDVSPEIADTAVGKRTFLLGTDGVGQDVLAQLMWACRLSISIGLVSTGIAVTIGVTLGSLMGYFGGWVDLLLYRVVEVFMAIPVLFLLVVAAGVLPRNTYVMMAIIGCVTWTGAARFTRAEFMKLRGQDFVQAARSLGLPLRSILFRHMLPNGVTPVLVDASFAIAVAIIVEATLSYLGLGPDNQASWGKLLSSATGLVGDFVWWLAIFPGLAIFLTVLSYNMLGEALRDAIDPKLRKAAH